MMTEAEFAAWLDGYKAAWEDGDPAAVGELFTAEATYRETPFVEPLKGNERALGFDLRVDPE